MSFTRRQVILIGAIGITALLLFVFIYFNIRDGGVRGPEVTLVFWGVEDPPVVIQKLTEGYTATHPGVKIMYQQFDTASYRAELINALAAGKGPDIFMIGNRSLPREKEKLAPVGAEVFPLVKLRDLFPQVVEEDFTSGGEVYALPLSLDTLALFYNKDLFDKAGIVGPPTTWQEFQSDIGLLRTVTATGQLDRMAAAIGGSKKTIPHGVDMLSTLMLQNGTQMIDARGTRATFASNPGLVAFNFYLQFANAGSPHYTWNDNQANAFESFAAGKTAMVFGYKSDLDAIREKNPYLNLRVAQLPQPAGNEKEVDYARYWGLAVSRQSPASKVAWDFVVTTATSLNLLPDYLNTTHRLPALLSYLDFEKTQPDFRVFAHEALNARSWYQADDEAVQNILNTAIQSVLTGKNTPERALAQAEEQVSQLMRQ